MACVRKAILVAAACPSPKFFTPRRSGQNDMNILSWLTANFVLGNLFGLQAGLREPELTAEKILQGEKRLGFREKIPKFGRKISSFRSGCLAASSSLVNLAVPPFSQPAGADGGATG
jgi:hypothetical protein